MKTEFRTSVYVCPYQMLRGAKGGGLEARTLGKLMQGPCSPSGRDAGFKEGARQLRQLVLMAFERIKIGDGKDWKQA